MSSASFDSFAGSEQNSLQWYDKLPGDGPVIKGIPQALDNRTLLAKIVNHTGTLSEQDIDICAARMFNCGTEDFSAEDYQALCEALSKQMASELTASGSRSLRMRSQRAHYYAQYLLTKDRPITGMQHIKHETTLPHAKPWDMLEHQTGRWIIASEDQNIHLYRADGNHQSWSHGLPTQIDVLGNDRLVIGSLYSNGCDITDGENWQHVDHDAPIVCMWQEDSETFFVDHFGTIWSYSKKEKRSQLPCNQVHFARYHDGILYGLDNQSYGSILMYEGQSQNSRKQITLPVMITNDIAFTSDHFYLVDKQQGCVFKFDKDWKFEQSILSFGRGEGQLLDPVSIRVHNDALHVISWINAKHTTLALF